MHMFQEGNCGGLAPTRVPYSVSAMALCHPTLGQPWGFSKEHSQERYTRLLPPPRPQRAGGPCHVRTVHACGSS